MQAIRKPGDAGYEEARRCFFGLAANLCRVVHAKEG